MQQIHLGIEQDFRPARTAHPGLLVDDLDSIILTLSEAGHTAGALGIRVGRVIDVVVQDTEPIVRPMMMAQAKMAEDTSFRPGQISVSRTVQVLFEIAGAP